MALTVSLCFFLKLAFGSHVEMVSNRWPFVGQLPSDVGDSNNLLLQMKYMGYDRVKRQHKLQGNCIQISCGQFPFFQFSFSFLKISLSDLCSSLKKPGFTHSLTSDLVQGHSGGKHCVNSFHSMCCKKSVCYRMHSIF